VCSCSFLVTGGFSTWYFWDDLFGDDGVPITGTVPVSYTKYVDMDVLQSDILCNNSNVSKDFCETKCNSEAECIGYNYVAAGGPWGDKSGCCLKNNNTNGVLKENNGVDFYMKLIN
jgi:hypothetical protein